MEQDPTHEPDEWVTAPPGKGGSRASVWPERLAVARRATVAKPWARYDYDTKGSANSAVTTAKKAAKSEPGTYEIMMRTAPDGTSSVYVRHIKASA